MFFTLMLYRFLLYRFLAENKEKKKSKEIAGKKYWKPKRKFIEYIVWFFCLLENFAFPDSSDENRSVLGVNWLSIYRSPTDKQIQCINISFL